MLDFTDSIWSNLRWSDIGFVVILTITSILSFRYGFPKLLVVLKRYAVLTCIFAALSYIYILCLGGFYKSYDRIIQEFMTYTSGVPTYTIAGHILFKIMEEERLKNPSVEELKAVDDWMHEQKERYSPNTCEETRKNVILLICESLESWPIGLSIDGKEITPYLNSLVNDSTSFYAPKVMTQVCNGHSIDGQLIYTTGLLPTSNTVYSMKYPDRNFPSLNKILKRDRNAKSILLTTDKPVTWNMQAVANSFGYDTIMHYYNWTQDEMMNRRMTDASFFRQAVAALKKGELWPEHTPAMLSFITISGHYPFIVKKELKDPDFDIDENRYPKILYDYITMTHYVDSQLKTVVDYIKGRSDYDETMIVILGDHEGLGVNRAEILKTSDFARRSIGKERYTPLLIVNSPVSGRYNGVLGQVDVFPTILDMLGVDDQEWRGMGISILDPARPEVAFSAIPPEAYGNTENCPADAIEHIKSAQSVSEMIIVHDLYGK